VPSAADDVAQAIAAAGGMIRFDTFMELALYGAHGFYTDGGRAGRRGDFITSPEVGPLFGAVLARWIDAEWQRLGRPDDFTVVEVGAGPGTLARAITRCWAAQSTEHPHRYVAVERSAAQRAAHPDGIESLAAVPEGRFTGVVVANELLDNLPFRLAVFDDGWREAFVATAPDGRFVEVLRPFDTVPAALPASAPHGARAPWQQQAGAWVDQARSHLAAGSVLVFDYGVARTAGLAARPWRDWLRTYRGHQRGAHYLRDTGLQDITTEVAVDQLPEPDEVRTQAQFLQRWGIDELVDEGRAAWAAAAAAPTVAAMSMRSRVREAEALLDPAGLGAFLSLVYRSGRGGE
jgi:SAM-dependent MidA family methyltransferase